MFVYARGAWYLTNDPDAWTKANHRSVAMCTDGQAIDYLRQARLELRNVTPVPAKTTAR